MKPQEIIDALEEILPIGQVGGLRFREIMAKINEINSEIDKPEIDAALNLMDKCGGLCQNAAGYYWRPEVDC